MISLSYSKISLRDICIKLHLDSEEDAQFIVAKAIRDGVIDATLDHHRGYMKSKVSCKKEKKLFRIHSLTFFIFISL
jgi:hypothetical protein